MADASVPEPPASSLPERAASDRPEPDQRKRHVWLRRLAAAVGALLVFVVAAVLIARYTQAPTIAPPSDTANVSNEWQSTIQRLNLVPVYPPQEDIVVGDVSVIVTWDNEAKGAQSLQGKAVHVARINMNAALEETYKSGHTFPDTVPRPKTDGDVWQQQAATDSIFAPTGARKSLPLVLLPNFTIARVRQASAGGGWLSGIGAAFGVEGEGQSTVELKIPFAETYGVPALIAARQLEAFCKDPKTSEICTQQGARNLLVDDIGSDIFARMSCPAAAKTAPGVKQPEACPPEESRPYRIDIEIMMIYRLYLIRSIETVTKSSSSFGAQAKMSKLGDELRQLQAGAPVANPNASPTDAAALRRALDDHKARLDALMAQMSSSSGAAAGLRSGDASNVSITQNLQRPVAIGYRAVKRIPE